MNIQLIAETMPQVRDVLTYAQRISDFDQERHYTMAKKLHELREIMLQAGGHDFERKVEKKIGDYPALDSATFFMKGAKMGLRRCAFAKDFITLDVERDLAIANLQGAIRFFELIFNK